MTDPTTTETNLDARIAAALSTTIPSNDAREILAGARQRVRWIEEALAKAERDSLDPHTPASKVRRARDRVQDLRFDRERTLASIDALEARVAELEANESEQHAEAVRDAAIARRDALVERLRRIPAIFDELAELFAAVRENDTELPAGVMSAEAVARGCPGNFFWGSGLGSGPVSRLTAMKLPRFDRAGNIWPLERRPTDYIAHYARQAAAAEADRQSRAQAEADRLTAHPWRTVKGPSFSYLRATIETMDGPRDVSNDLDRSYRFRMSDAQAEAARAKGLTVTDEVSDGVRAA